MGLTPGARLGVYEIVSALGAGGMGEVFRARDTKLNRDVAIKVLASSIAGDLKRLDRFTREAQTLASLNHPNIAQIHGLEESNGVRALVMELVEGEDLSQRIARGPIAITEAIPIAQQIAEALEAAHEQGIIHRDLKPANIKVRPDGRVKVLDFGLAKTVLPPGSPAAVSHSLTITEPAMTQAGIILGTAPYMSPEQVRGRSVDRRTDIWAFGCVLYEMLTGTRAFGGEGVSETLANVLKSEPDWSVLPTTVPGTVRTLLRRCLTKDRKRRLDSAADARLEIDEALTMPLADVGAAAAGMVPVGWRRVAMMTMAAVVAVGVAAATTIWLATRPAPRSVIRTAIPTSGASSLTARTFGPHIILTPDGSRVAYVGAAQILVRALNQPEPTVLPRLGAPQGLFVAPDGQRVGYFDGTSLKSVAITGGTPVTIAALDGFPHGATWNADETIVFATNTLTTGLQRVAAGGGAVTVLTTPDRERGEVDHVWPEFLPDGESVLFTIRGMDGELDTSDIAVLNLRTGTQVVLLRGGSHARYAPTGHLVYAAGGGLRAVAFDLRRLTVTGTPVPMQESVAVGQAGGIEVALARDGTFIYLADGAFDALAQRTLVWVDRHGREAPLGTPPRAYQTPRISPDGTRVAVSIADQEPDLWVWEIARRTLNRLTSEPGADGRAPLWMLDNRRLVFSSRRAGVTNLYVQSADGTQSATRLTDGPNPQFPTGITPDGRRVVFFEMISANTRALKLLTLTPTPEVTPLVATRFGNHGGVVSPDGRWLAYESNSTGRYETYVRPFPAVNEGLWPISTDGGVQPLWAPSGRELFYVAPDGSLMGVSVEPRGADWSSGRPARLVEGRYFMGGGQVLRRYDVSADGQRFLMIKEDPAKAAASAQIVVVQNWFEELKRLVPTK